AATSGRSTSRDSRIGLPLSSDSSTASSRDRSAMIRAIRNRYFARSRPGIGPQTCSYAARAALTARSTSPVPATATSASTSSVAGFTDFITPPSVGSTNAPLMNRPYAGRISAIVRDSGAGAYSKRDMAVPGVLGCSVQGDVVGTVVVPGGQLAALHQQVVEEGGGADPEPVRVQPRVPGGLVDQHQVPDRVLGGADAAGRLHPHRPAGHRVPLPDRLQHHQRDRQGRGRTHLAGGGLD